MTAVTPQLNTMQVEECKYESSVSEAVMTRMAAVVNYMAQNAIDSLGTVIHSALTEAQFATLKGYDHTAAYAARKWVLMDGTSISGSDFAVLTGITTLPDAVTNGAFLGQKKAANSMTEYQAFQKTAPRTGVSNGGNSINPSRISIETFSTDPGFPIVDLPDYSSNLGSEVRPNTVRINIFIKINNA